MTVMANITKTLNTHPIATLTLGSLGSAGLSVAAGELGHIMGHSPLQSMGIYHFMVLLLIIKLANHFKVYPMLWQKHISIRALIYGALWLLPVAYALWLNPNPVYESLIHKNVIMQIGQVILSVAYQEFLYRVVVLILLINILVPRQYPMAYIVLASAVLSALPQLYMLLTPAPLVYVLYQIIWATLYAMVAVYAMLLWRNIGVMIALHAITQLYAGFDAPVLGVPAMYVSLLWFAILAIIGRILCKPNDMTELLFNKEGSS